MYDVDGDGVVDRQEYQTMVQDMAALRHARLREDWPEERGARDVEVGRRRGWLSFVFGGRGDEALSDYSKTAAPVGDDAAGATDDEGIWDSVDDGEGSIVVEGLNVDLRRLLFGAIPGVKKVRHFVHEGMRSRSISLLSSSYTRSSSHLMCIVLLDKGTAWGATHFETFHGYVNVLIQQGRYNGVRPTRRRIASTCGPRFE